MPGLLYDPEQARKRKREDTKQSKRRVAQRRETSEDDDEDGAQDEILRLEAEIVETGNVENSITKLLDIFSPDQYDLESQLTAAVALCRVFYRFVATGRLIKTKGLSPEERARIDWLRDRSRQYADGLCGIVTNGNAQAQSTALTLLMRIVKAEVSQQETRSSQAWKTGSFSSLVACLISTDSVRGPLSEFVETFVEEFDDVRFYTFRTVAGILSDAKGGRKEKRALLKGSLDLLLQVEGIPDSNDQLQDWYGTVPEQSTHPLLSLKAHQKQAQEAWLAVFQSGIDVDQRKRILDSFTERIAPWFPRPETMMDFLTDSYNEGGPTSLLALSGVYHLIKERNLDYPQFYHKLYSLLDDGILHSKHRARFFRLLDIFLSSSHLPAALVASFVKRLSRLALYAPPGGIVMVVPWVYNMMRKHPQCTFLLHREVRDPGEKASLEASGMDDPFDMAEPDPMRSSALASSLWELHSLQHHYHPNVATLAKIIGEQFTKQEYNLEDFLDHSYRGLIDAELGKDLKKAPVVEYEIPKRIVTSDDGGLNRMGSLLQAALQA
ncbi:hypothetical protein CAC42_4297 [Sphaceloma murrayae]|uniref:CCAAT-binding factor domain-containing protein n=1 Tax=Sphaceloma murrayae TaxID=2082308 RepID=A0A2K1QL08_9PEZI|nr:hypothetical protein CAC42_4297 [Sphaceloma murrayae]